MMLNVSKENYTTREHYYPLLSSLALVFFFIFWYFTIFFFDLQPHFFDVSFSENLSRHSYYSDYSVLLGAQTNSQNLAQILYSYNFIPFFLSGLVLLVAMIGSIALTIYHREDTRRQFIFKQTEKSYSRAIRLSDVSSIDFGS
jgi:NADH:ubiquinone oxidoreductase subunit 6 (subunit J)